MPTTKRIMQIYSMVFSNKNRTSEKLINKKIVRHTSVISPKSCVEGFVLKAVAEYFFNNNVNVI